MTRDQIRDLLEMVSSGVTAPGEALERLARLPYEDTGFARIDHHRSLRLGLPEVIYAAGKTPAQVASIFARMVEAGGDVLATRASLAAADAVLALVPQAQFYETARIVGLRQTGGIGEQSGTAEQFGTVAVLCAGTSDLPVAEEAAVTLEHFGIPVERVYDVGVAGLHRILSQQAVLARACCVIVCAGMEGALPSVVGGLVAAPVLAVPTSVGYGAAFGGLAALLGMLNSCSPNVSVVNIDNGFGAAYSAAMIARSAKAGKSAREAEENTVGSGAVNAV